MDCVVLWRWGTSYKVRVLTSLQISEAVCYLLVVNISAPDPINQPFFLCARPGSKCYLYFLLKVFQFPLFQLKVNMDFFCSPFKNTFVLILDSSQTTGHKSWTKFKAPGKHSHGSTVYVEQCLWGLGLCSAILCQTARWANIKNDKLQNVLCHVLPEAFQRSYFRATLHNSDLTYGRKVSYCCFLDDIQFYSYSFISTMLWFRRTVVQ